MSAERDSEMEICWEIVQFGNTVTLTELNMKVLW